jgi:hypothetical protein
MRTLVTLLLGFGPANYFLVRMTYDPRRLVCTASLSGFRAATVTN